MTSIYVLLVVACEMGVPYEWLLYHYIYSSILAIPNSILFITLTLYKDENVEMVQVRYKMDLITVFA